MGKRAKDQIPTLFLYKVEVHIVFCVPLETKVTWREVSEFLPIPM